MRDPAAQDYAVLRNDYRHLNEEVAKLRKLLKWLKKHHPHIHAKATELVGLTED